MALNSYVSVTAGKNSKEVNDIILEFQDAGYSLSGKYVPALGIQVSEKTLNGIRPNNFRMAPFEEIPELVEMTDGKVMPVIHYNTKNTETLSEQVSRVFESAYSFCKMVQINATFPERRHFEILKEKFDGLLISLQLDYSGMDIGTAITRAISYGDSLDYILIDPSRGRGDMFDMDKSVSLYQGIKEERPDYGIVFAGGLSGDNLEEILGKIVDKIKTTEFSICAEGQLRDKVSDEHWGQDEVNLLKVREYLHTAKRMFKQPQ